MGLYICNDLRSEIDKLTDPSNGIGAQIQTLDKTVERMATIQERLLLDVRDLEEDVDELTDGDK